MRQRLPGKEIVGAGGTLCRDLLGGLRHIHTEPVVEMIVGDLHRRSVSTDRPNIDATWRWIAVVNAVVKFKGVNNSLSILGIEVYTLLESGLGCVDGSRQPPKGMPEIAR